MIYTASLAMMLGTTKEKTGADFVAREAVDLNDYKSIISERMDLLFEKRHTIREAALTALNNVLTLRYCGTPIDSRQETLTEGLQRVLQRAEEKELLLALKCILLVSITIGDGRETFINNMTDSLKKIINDESHTTPISARAAAVDTLSMSCFMASIKHDDLNQALSAIQTLQNIFHDKNSPIDVQRAAVTGWALLATTLPDNIIKDNLFPANIERLYQLLEESDIEIRIAAGKAIALLLESMGNLKKQTLGEYEDFSLDMIESKVHIQEILDALYDVMEDKSKNRSKAERKRQRATFREIISFIKSGEVPKSSVIIRGFQLVLDSWSQILQMDHMKAHLGEGYMSHMEENPNLMYIFDYHIDLSAPPEPPLMTKKERRLSMEVSARALTRAKEAGRRQREQRLSGYATE